jgi:hypothetical protein
LNEHFGGPCVVINHGGRLNKDGGGTAAGQGNDAKPWVAKLDTPMTALYKLQQEQQSDDELIITMGFVDPDEEWPFDDEGRFTGNTFSA